MEKETRVGYMTISILQDFCKEAIKYYHKHQDYERMNHYISVYKSNELYMQGGK